MQLLLTIGSIALVFMMGYFVGDAYGWHRGYEDGKETMRAVQRAKEDK